MAMYRDQFLRFKDNEVKELTVMNWDFSKHPSGYLFRCYVTKENGEKTDKIWTVWDYETMVILKKKLKARYTSGSKELKVKKLRDEDDEVYFEIE